MFKLHVSGNRVDVILEANVSFKVKEEDIPVAKDIFFMPAVSTLKESLIKRFENIDVSIEAEKLFLEYLKLSNLEETKSN